MFRGNFPCPFFFFLFQFEDVTLAALKMSKKESDCKINVALMRNRQHQIAKHNNKSENTTIVSLNIIMGVIWPQPRGRLVDSNKKNRLGWFI